MDTSSETVRVLSHRLPTTIVPSHYLLYIDASQLEQYLFQGVVDIDLQVWNLRGVICKEKDSFNIQINGTSNEIILNSVDLNITKIEYYENEHSTTVLTGTAEFNDEYEQVTIKFPEPIQV